MLCGGGEVPVEDVTFFIGRGFPISLGGEGPTAVEIFLFSEGKLECSSTLGVGLGVSQVLVAAVDVEGFRRFSARTCFGCGELSGLGERDGPAELDIVLKDLSWGLPTEDFSADEASEFRPSGGTEQVLEIGFGRAGGLGEVEAPDERALEESLFGVEFAGTSDDILIESLNSGAL